MRGVTPPHSLPFLAGGIVQSRACMPSCVLHQDAPFTLGYPAQATINFRTNFTDSAA